MTSFFQHLGQISRSLQSCQFFDWCQQTASGDVFLHGLCRSLLCCYTRGISEALGGNKHLMHRSLSLTALCKCNTLASSCDSVFYTHPRSCSCIPKHRWITASLSQAKRFSYLFIFCFISFVCKNLLSRTKACLMRFVKSLLLN